MKRKNIILITLLLLISILSYSLTACSKNKVIVEIDNAKLTLDDFLYDIYLIEQEREVWNSNYKESLGIDYWDYEFEGTSMIQLSKDTIMTRVILYEILSKQAKKEGHTLTNNELTTLEENVDKLIASMSEAELKETGMDRDLLLKAYNKLSLGDKYYMAVTEDFEVNEEAIQDSIDSDEYREYKTECLYIPTAEVSYQKVTPFNEDEQEISFDKISTIKELVIDGVEFEEIIEQLEGVTYYERNFILSDITAEEEYKEMASTLNNGDYSDIVTTKFGHYIIHMLDNNSPDRYEMATQNAIQEEKTALFKLHYDEIIKDYEIEINSEYWESIELGTITSKN